jgi:hypothetical protein
MAPKKVDRDIAESGFHFVDHGWWGNLASISRFLQSRLPEFAQILARNAG